MLTLSLKRGDYVQIGNDIKIYNREPRQIDLAFDAPKDVTITRVAAKDNPLHTQ